MQEDPEYTMTRNQWEDTQLRFEIRHNTLEALSDQARAERAIELGVLNQQAVRSALASLVLLHPVEFEGLVTQQRRALDIETEVSTEFGDYVNYLETHR